MNKKDKEHDVDKIGSYKIVSKKVDFLSPLNGTQAI